MRKLQIFAGMLAVLVLIAGFCLPRTCAGETKVPARPKQEQVRGFSIQLSEANGVKGYLKAIDDLSDMGCTWVNFAIAARQNDIKSESVHIAWQNIPSQKDIERILRYAKSKGMSTMVMPIVLLDHASSKEWRGVIEPPDWDVWFDSYTKYIVFVAKLAHACDVDIFSVGSELLSTESFRSRWANVIAEVRKIYFGKLTYSANWDHYEFPVFWDQLDYVSMNCYHELADRPGATVAELNKAWVTERNGKPAIKPSLLAFVEKQKKPFFFTEVGWHNLQNTVSEPWNYVAEGEIDPTEQLHAYQSFVETWGNVPNTKFMGAFFWEWKPGGKPTDHGSYSLQGEPALEVVKKWMAAK